MPTASNKKQHALSPSQWQSQRDAPIFGQFHFLLLLCSVLASIYRPTCHKVIELSENIRGPHLLHSLRSTGGRNGPEWH